MAASGDLDVRWKQCLSPICKELLAPHYFSDGAKVYWYSAAASLRKAGFAVAAAEDDEDGLSVLPQRRLPAPTLPTVQSSGAVHFKLDGDNEAMDEQADEDADDDAGDAAERYGDRIGEMALIGGTNGATPESDPESARPLRPTDDTTWLSCGRVSALIERSRRLIVFGGVGEWLNRWVGKVGAK